jgi:hypothetical protein
LNYGMLLDGMSDFASILSIPYKHGSIREGT